MPVLVFMFCFEPFGIIFVSDNAICLNHAKKALYTCSVYRCTLILLVNTGEVTKKLISVAVINVSVRVENSYIQACMHTVCIHKTFYQCISETRGMK